MPADRGGPPRSRRELARSLTRAARASIGELLEMETARPEAMPWTIAITGPAGVGKSTLVSRLAPLRLERLKAEASGRRDLLAVLAIDPSSPLSGGAILGDRIRMDDVAGDPGIFVRSLASGGSYGGLSRNIVNILSVVQNHGFDEVIVETVGAGQSEYAVRNLAETVVLVLQPETGDFVQAMKSGIMEVADIYVVNKAHLPNASRTVAELEGLLKYTRPTSSDWRPRVVAIREPEDVKQLDATIEDHRGSLSDEEVEERRERRERQWLSSMIARRIDEITADGSLLQDLPDRVDRYRYVLKLLAGDAEPHSGE